MSIDRMRGNRDDMSFDERVARVVKGEGHDETNRSVISSAANEMLKPALKAKTAADKGGILSLRQINRRKRREIPIGHSHIGFLNGRFRVVEQGDYCDET
jgi:hypothetical protein